MKRNGLLTWLILPLALVLPLSAYGRSIDLQGSPLEKVAKAAWSYRGEQGPDNWGRLSPAFALCQTGRLQSPVDLIPLGLSRLPPLRFHYRTNPLRILNDGLTIRVNYGPGSYLSIGNRSYELKEMAFRVPSEHTVDGQHADMEIQLSHQNSAGDYVMLAIPITAGVRHNAMLERMWEYIPTGMGSGRYYRQVGVNPVFFLPTDRSYYRYTGSLTDPPCSESVTWLVMQRPVEVAGQLINQLRLLMGENNRPVQAVNGRSILTSR